MMGGWTRQVVGSVATLVMVWYSASLRTSARWLCCPPHLVVLMAAAILASCCFSTFMVEFDGWPMILSIGMGAMMARTALQTAALLAVGEDMFVLQKCWLIVGWIGF